VDRLGTGVAIYVKNDYHVVHRNDLEVLGVECVWVEIKISKNHPVLIGTFNRPPDSLKEVNWVMHPSNSSKSGSDIDEADGIEVD
jgi:hypothetical protein